MARQDKVLRLVAISCLLEGAIVFGLAFGFLASGWVSVAGVGVALLSLAALALLARLVALKRW